MAARSLVSSIWEWCSIESSTSFFVVWAKWRGRQARCPQPASAQSDGLFGGGRCALDWEMPNRGGVFHGRRACWPLGRFCPCITRDKLAVDRAVHGAPWGGQFLCVKSGCTARKISGSSYKKCSNSGFEGQRLKPLSFKQIRVRDVKRHCLRAARGCQYRGLRCRVLGYPLSNGMAVAGPTTMVGYISSWTIRVQVIF